MPRSHPPISQTSELYPRQGEISPLLPASAVSSWPLSTGGPQGAAGAAGDMERLPTGVLSRPEPAARGVLLSAPHSAGEAPWRVSRAAGEGETLLRREAGKGGGFVQFRCRPLHCDNS